MMTEEEGITKLIQFCDADIKQSGWWIFNDKQLLFTKTRLLKPYERIANLPLPESLKIQNTLFDNHGVTIGTTLYEWKDISATGIKTETVAVNDIPKFRFDAYFLCCLHTGEIIEVSLGDIKHLYGQLGHFIEQYKSG